MHDRATPSSLAARWSWASDQVVPHASRPSSDFLRSTPGLFWMITADQSYMIVHSQRHRVASAGRLDIRRADAHRCDQFAVDPKFSALQLDPSVHADHAGLPTTCVMEDPSRRRQRSCCGDEGTQLLLGHTKLESTVRYFGIEVDDALEIAEQTED